MKKILFIQKTQDGNFMTEGLWCVEQNSHFVVDNIPFVVKRVAVGDVVAAEFDASDNSYYFEDFIQVSGHSTVRLFLRQADIIESVRKDLEQLGCESEILLSALIVAVDIPKNIDYKKIKQYLENGEDKGLWEYEEACLSHNPNT